MPWAVAYPDCIPDRISDKQICEKLEGPVCGLGKRPLETRLLESPDPSAAGPTEKPPLTDSGWFWALLFSLMALLAIALIGPKWDWRQRQLEGRYLGRQQAALERQRRAEGLDPVDLADAAADREAVAPERIVPAWTLTAVAAVAAVGSAAMLWRERWGSQRQPRTERRRAR